MKNKIFKTAMFFAAAFTLFSCEKFNDDEIIDDKEANSTLVVRTRALTVDGSSDGSSTVSYPINVYIFDENNKCVELSSISTGSEEMTIKLREGSYDVYAVAGADAETYDLPTKDNATKESLITLKSGKNHNDLMTANNTVSLVYGEVNTLTLSLQRKVMLIESVTINDVPTDVTQVTVAVSPLYESLMLNGNYSGESGSHEITLTKESSGNAWTNSDGVYLLEASGAATVKISFTKDETSTSTTTSYSYSCPEELKANYKINISGNYTGNDIELVGTIKGAEWASTKNITFDFDEDGSTTTTNPSGGEEGGNTGTGDDTETGNDDTGGDVTTNAPEVGTLYNGCYVLKTEQTGNGTLVTLMSAKAANNLSFTEGNQTSIKAAVDEAIATLAVNVDGITGWRLPTLEEITYISTYRGDIGDYIVSIRNAQGNSTADILTTNGPYYFETSEGKIQTYFLTNGTINEPVSGKNYINLRAITTITFSN